MSNLKSKNHKLALFVKGFCMGTADIIPGVSGGTVALILGIYQELITTISSFNLKSIKVLFSFNFSEIKKELNLTFTIPLFLGIIAAIVLMARVMHFLMLNYSICLLYTSPSPRDRTRSRMPSSA